jgi:hypothetical protein
VDPAVSRKITPQLVSCEYLVSLQVSRELVIPRQIPTPRALRREPRKTLAHSESRRRLEEGRSLAFKLRTIPGTKIRGSVNYFILLLGLYELCGVLWLVGVVLVPLYMCVNFVWLNFVFFIDRAPVRNRLARSTRNICWTEFIVTYI